MVKSFSTFTKPLHSRSLESDSDAAGAQLYATPDSIEACVSRLLTGSRARSVPANRLPVVILRCWRLPGGAANRGKVAAYCRCVVGAPALRHVSTWCVYSAAFAPGSRALSLSRNSLGSVCKSSASTNSSLDSMPACSKREAQATQGDPQRPSPRGALLVRTRKTPHAVRPKFVTPTSLIKSSDADAFATHDEPHSHESCTQPPGEPPLCLWAPRAFYRRLKCATCCPQCCPLQDRIGPVRPKSLIYWWAQ